MIRMTNTRVKTPMGYFRYIKLSYHIDSPVMLVDQMYRQAQRFDPDVLVVEALYEVPPCPSNTEIVMGQGFIWYRSM